jgi:hypothetical protein
MSRAHTDVACIEEKPQQAGRRRQGFYVGGSGGEDGPTPQEVQVSGVR